MATYKEIKGVTVQTLDEDPVTAGGSWSSGPSINTARFQVPGAGATQSASYIVGGAIPGTSPNISALHEQFDGSSWTEVGDLGTAKYAAGTFGTPSAALITAGYSGAYTNTTENWNGSSWTAGTASNTTRGYLGASGTTTDGLIYGGVPGATGNTEKYNGSSWTETGDLNTARRSGGQSNLGSGSAAIFSGGNPPFYANTEQFNGSSWSETTDLNTARVHQWGMGTSTAQIICGGAASGTPHVANTESWNGSTWTEVNDLGTASLANACAGGGTSTSAIIAAQYTGSLTTQSEQWDFPPVTAAILTEGDLFLSGGTTLKSFGKAAGIPSVAWGSGGDVNTARNSSRGMGTVNTAMIAAGGYDGTAAQVITEQYNGSSWTEVGDMSTAKTQGAAAGQSPYQDSIMFAGSPTLAVAEKWNGSTWTEVGDLNTGRRELAGVGISSSNAMAISGQASTDNVTNVESWDGSSWTEIAEVNTGRSEDPGAGGSNTSAVFFGGNPSTNKTETWNGTSWTEVNDLNTGREGLAGAGFSSSALAIGGGPSATAKTEIWNGTSWTESNDLTAARRMPGGGASAASCLAISGLNPSNSEIANTEEWTADNALSTITVS